MTKVALLIGVSEYEPGLNPLPGAVKDVDAMQRVLTHPEMGGFAETDITVLKNPQRQTMEDAIFSLFAGRKKDDLLLFYFSGHGIKDENGRLYLATRTTRKDSNGRLIPPSAVAAASLHDNTNGSRSQRQVMILDCCFSGAIAQGMTVKDDGTVNLKDYLGSKGRAILTSSTSTEYSFGSSTGGHEDDELSIYTRYLVEGIRTGGADLDDDGLIAVEELHAYASSKVKEAAPTMTPRFYPVEEGYKIILAKSPKNDPQLKYRKQVKLLAQEDEGNFSFISRAYLDELKQSLGLQPDATLAIETEELEPYRQRRAKVDRYRKVFEGAIAHRYPLTDRDRAGLQRLQQLLSLRDEDIAAIEAELRTYFEFEVVTVNAEGKETNRTPGRARSVSEELGNGVTLEMVAIPAGEYLMGTADGDRDTIIREQTRYKVSQENAEKYMGLVTPQHRVELSAFWMGRFPVVQAQWNQVAELPKIKSDLNPDPSKFKGANRPVENVSWEEAMEFCDRLSRKTGNSYRLPSEAEWEYACRAGTTTPFHFGETITSDFVNCRGNNPYGNAPKSEYRRQTTDVGTFPPNGFGLYDMHGNVLEWCADVWHENYQGAPTDGSVWAGSENNRRRLRRGGSWLFNPVDCRSAHRYYNNSNLLSNYIGFRVVCSALRTLS